MTAVHIGLPSPLGSMPCGDILDHVGWLLAKNNGHLREDFVVIHVLTALSTDLVRTQVTLIFELDNLILCVALAVRHGHQTELRSKRVHCLL